MDIFVSGVSMGPGSRFTTDCAWMSGNKPGVPLNQRLPCSTAKPDRGGAERGYGAGKKTFGRKRHLLVDTLGLVLLTVVHAAGIQDRDGARLVLAPLAHSFTRLRKIWADGGYAGALVEWVRNLRTRHRIDLEIVKRTDDLKGFVVLPKRWIVERTFAWLSFHRRLSKDYEYLPETSESFIHISMIRLMLARLA